MYGQMTAGSWIYIGTQGILQGTYETFAAVAKQHFGGTLKGTITLTAGLGGMGGAQPLAVTMNEGIVIAVEIDPNRIQKRMDTKYCDRMTYSLDEALRWAQEAKEKGEALSIGLVGNAAEVHHELLTRGVHIDIVTDQTSAHDPLNGYVPEGLSLEEAAELRKNNPEQYVRRSKQSMAKHVEAMLEFQNAVRSFLTTATIFAKSLKTKESKTPLRFQGLFLRISVRYFVKEKDRSVGQRYPAIQKIFIAQMN